MMEKKRLILISTFIIVSIVIKVMFETSSIFHILLALVGLAIYLFAAIKEYRKR